MIAATRLAKIVLMAMVALFTSLVVFNNLTDYDSNYQFVRHVLLMDTTFPGNAGMWRAIHAPWVHHAGYVLIIAAEALVAFLAMVATLRLWQARLLDRPAFNQAKAVGIYALTLGILLWFGGFIAIGGEWFLMWQSEIWNGQQAAFRIAAIFAIILVFLAQEEAA